MATRRWTSEEDELLISKIQELGPKWTILAQFSPDRTDLQLKNRWIRKLAHRAGGLKSPRRQPVQLVPRVGSPVPIAMNPLAGAIEGTGGINPGVDLFAAQTPPDEGSSSDDF
jgi:hypothetical protein